MNGLAIVISCLPILGWGLMPIFAKVFKGSAVETMVGTTTIVLVLTAIYTFIFPVEYTWSNIIVSFGSGLFWGLGQWLQFEGLALMDVSKAMPLSNGTQLVFTTMIAWLFLQEWQGSWRGILSVVALVVMIFGVHLATKKEQKRKNQHSFKAVGLICLSSLALSSYVSLPKFFDVFGEQLFLPQALGMFSVSLLLVCISKEKMRQTIVIKNFITGLCWIIANTALFYASQFLGLGLSFAVSQMCVLVSIYGGVVFLNDQKSHSEKQNLKTGAFLLFISIIVFGLAK